MYCPQCGTKNEPSNHFCVNCGGALNHSTNPSNQTPMPKASERKTSPLKPGKPLKIVLVVVAILLVAFVGWIALSDDDTTDIDTKSKLADSAKSETNSDQGDNGPAKHAEENPSENKNADQMTIDELTSLVQQSKSATVELVRDQNSKQSLNTDEDETLAILKALDFEKFKQDFVPSNFQSIDYPFNYLPEYRLTFDTGVSYTIMQDNDGETRMAIIKFDNNSTYWSASEFIYRRTNVIQTTLMDDFSNMHIFCTASDEKTAMNNVLNHGLVYSFILDYFTGLGYGFEGEGIYKVEDILMGDMPETDPNLHWAMIQYSLKPSQEGTLPDNMNIYMEDGWIRGGYVLAAIWNESRPAGVRSYLLGLTPFEYDVNGTSEAEAALMLYEQSFIKKLHFPHPASTE